MLSRPPPPPDADEVTMLSPGAPRPLGAPTPSICWIPEPAACRSMTSLPLACVVVLNTTPSMENLCVPPVKPSLLRAIGEPPDVVEIWKSSVWALTTKYVWPSLRKFDPSVNGELLAAVSDIVTSVPVGTDLSGFSVMGLAAQQSSEASPEPSSVAPSGSQAAGSLMPVSQ